VENAVTIPAALYVALVDTHNKTKSDEKNSKPGCLEGGVFGGGKALLLLLVAANVVRQCVRFPERELMKVKII
jgi:hypothetical protein